MTDTAVEVEWERAGLQFLGGAVGGCEVRLDGFGKTGVSPVDALLISLAGCMAADVVDILTKGRVPFAGLRVRVEGDRVPDAPRRFRAIRLLFETTGLARAHEEKLQRAIQLSQERYCSVMHSLRADIEFSTGVVLN